MMLMYNWMIILFSMFFWSAVPRSPIKGGWFVLRIISVIAHARPTFPLRRDIALKNVMIGNDSGCLLLSRNFLI